MRGFVQVLTLILILGGIGLGAYYLPILRTALTPKAASLGINVLESNEGKLALRLIAPWPPFNEDNLEEFTMQAQVAEDPNFSNNVFSINPYTQNPSILNYSLSDISDGAKTVYVKFISSLGAKRVYLTTIELKNIKQEITNPENTAKAKISSNKQIPVPSNSKDSPSSSAAAPVPAPAPSPKPSAPYIALIPSSGTFDKNCKFSLSLEVDTGTKLSDGVDVILKYDPSQLSVSSVNKGSIFPTYPPPLFESGRIVYSGLPPINKPFSGEGIFASIEFLVNKDAPGEKADITLEFDSNDKLKLTDTNILESGTFIDVLNTAINGSYSIGSGSCN